MTIPKPKNLKLIGKKITSMSLLAADKNELTADDVKPAREYIAKYWSKLTRYHPKEGDSLISLPHPYLVPAYEKGHEFDFNELYYWDSYFMVQGILDNDHKKLVLGILENIFSLYERFHIIPNASRTYLMGRSQPPLMTSFIMDVYQTYMLDKKWLKKAMKIAEGEYKNVWLGKTKPNARLVYEGLSRYYDINYLDNLAEAESGWDMSPRFNGKALNFLPVDLNSLLYKYERDFAATAKILGDNEAVTKWDQVSHERRMAMNRLMWSDLRGLYYDYNFVKKNRSRVASLAAYYPLWAGLASDKQAARLVGSLRKFERRGGLTTTDSPQVGSLLPGTVPTQWAYPNGWAPLHFIAVKGLERYGYHGEARRIALKWLNTNLLWFKKHKVFLEKYNVVTPGKPPAKGLYPSQTGFGWTNSVFEYLCQKYIDNG